MFIGFSAADVEHPLTSRPNPAVGWLPQDIKEFKVSTSKSLPNRVLKKVEIPPRKVVPTEAPKRDKIIELQKKEVMVTTTNVKISVITKPVISEKTDNEQIKDSVKSDSSSEVFQKNSDESVNNNSSSDDYQDNSDEDVSGDSSAGDYQDNSEKDVNNNSSSGDYQDSSDENGSSDSSDDSQDGSEKDVNNDSSKITSASTPTNRTILEWNSKRTKRRSKFGSRFRLGKKDVATARFFPPDHLNDDSLNQYFKIVAKEERKVLTAETSSFLPYLPYFERVLNETVVDAEKVGNPRYVMTIPSERFETMLLKTESDSFCQGCFVTKEYRISYKIVSPEIITFRRFVGNREIRNANVNDTGRC